MFLYLVQHGLSLTEEQNSERPLSPEGKKQTQKTAAFLKTKSIRVDCLWHSAKLRAIQTAQIIARAVSCSEILQRDDLNPLDSPARLPDEIQSLNKSLMIVGHLPFLQKLASLLLTGSENYPLVSFKNSGVVCLEFRETWKIAWILTPELM